MKSLACGVAFAALAFAVATCAANANLITNGSFEDTTGFTPGGDNSMGLGVGSTTITGWTVNGGGDGIAWIGPANPYGIVAPDGQYSLDITGYTNGPPYGGVQQSISTTSGNTYELTFEIGGFSGGGTYSIDASAGGPAQTFSFTTAPATNSQNVWTTETLDFTASGSTTLISLIGSASPGSEDYIGLDNVSVVQTGVSSTPLPAALPLFAGGLGAMALFGRRRKRKAQSMLAAA